MSVEDEKVYFSSGDGPPPDGQNIPIPDHHYTAIGKVADAWSDLEFEIDRLIWHLLETNQALGACVTSQMVSVHPRLTALGSLVRLWEVGKPLLDELATLDGTARGLSDRRNRMIHDKRMIWWKTKEVVRFQVSAKKELTFGPQPETIAELMEFRDTVLKLFERFAILSQKIRNETLSSPSKPRGPLPYIFRSTDPI
jgi:hypothetical protein